MTNSTINTTLNLLGNCFELDGEQIPSQHQQKQKFSRAKISSYNIRSENNPNLFPK